MNRQKTFSKTLDETNLTLSDLGKTIGVVSGAVIGYQNEDGSKIILLNIPSSDPGIEGQWYRDGQIIKVSEG
jgi:hypothetical protein